MFKVKPYFYDNFVCKADKCGDTCCAGWEIDIDNDTLQKYNNVKGDFSEVLRSGISLNDSLYSFRLKENERCWFLAENGLCDIYSNLGKDFLCDICREHPRFYNYYDNSIEKGLGLCCERVCEMLFENDNPFFLSVSGEIPNDDYYDLFVLRKQCFDMISDKKNYLCDNIARLLLFAIEIQKAYFEDEFNIAECEDKLSLFKNLLSLYSETEPVNREWVELLQELSDNIDKVVAVSDSFDFNDVYYEKTLSYILYRHLIESAFIGSFIGGISFAVSAVVFIHMINCLHFVKYGKITVSDMINSVKLWSKQTEYSRENTDFLIERTVDIFYN